MKRRKMSRKSSKRSFRKGNGQHKKNRPQGGIMRGGYRL